MAMPTRVRATSWRAKPRAPSQQHASAASAAAAAADASSASSLTRKSSISASSPLAKAFEKGAAVEKADKGAMQLLVRLFEPLVIRAMNLYCNTSVVGLQRGVLFLLAQLVMLRVNYTLLDSDNMFLTFLAKQVESIAAGAVVAGHELLPFLFEFFLLLARDQQSLPPEAMNVPKIVDLANSLLSSTSISCDRVIPALLPIAIELLGAPQHGGRGRREPAADAALSTQREALAAMLCSHLGRPAAVDVLVRSLRAARGHPERWGTLSKHVSETLVPAMAGHAVPANGDRVLDAVFALADAISPGSVRPEPKLFGSLFEMEASPLYGRAPSASAFEWVASAILLLRFAAKFPEDAVASAVVQLGDACVGHASATDALFVRVFDLVRASAANLAADRAPCKAKIRQFGELLLHASGAVLASRRARSRRLFTSASAFLAANATAVGETHALVSTLASGHPSVVLFWLHLLCVAGYTDGRFWMTASGILSSSVDHTELSHGLRVVRRGAFVLWSRAVQAERESALAAGVAVATETPATSSRFARAVVRAWEESAIQRIASRLVANDRARDVLVAWIGSQGVRGGAHALGPSGGLRCVSVLMKMPPSPVVAVAAIRGILPTHHLAVRRAAAKCIAAVVDAVAGSPLEVMDIRGVSSRGTPGITVVVEEAEAGGVDDDEVGALRAQRRETDLSTIVRELECAEIDVVRLPELYASLKRARATEDDAPLVSRGIVALSAQSVRVDAKFYADLLMSIARGRRASAENAQSSSFAHLLAHANDATFADVVSLPSLCNELLPSVVTSLKRRAQSRLPKEAPTAPTTPRVPRPRAAAPDAANATTTASSQTASTVSTASVVAGESQAADKDATLLDTRPSMDSGVADSDEVPVVALPDASLSSIVLTDQQQQEQQQQQQQASDQEAAREHDGFTAESVAVASLVFSRARGLLVDAPSSTPQANSDADADCPEWCDWDAGLHVLEALADVVACMYDDTQLASGLPLMPEPTDDQLALAARFAVAGLSAAAYRVRTQEALPADLCAVVVAVSSLLAFEKVSRHMADPAQGRTLAWAVVSLHAIHESVLHGVACDGRIAPPTSNLPDGRLHVDQQRMLTALVVDCSGVLHVQPRMVDAVGRRIHRPHRHVPQSFAALLRSLAIRIARIDTSLVHTYAVVHGKKKSEMDDGGPPPADFGGDGLPRTLLETDHLQDVDILASFLQRVGLLGYEDQHRFEELWAALLSVIGATVPAESTPSAYEPEDVRATCLAVRGMTHILLQSLLKPKAGDTLGFYPATNRPLPPKSSRTMVRARAVLAAEKITAQMGVIGGPKQHNVELALAVYTGNIETSVWGAPTGPFPVASYRLFRAPLSAAHSLTSPPNPQPATQQAAGHVRGAVYLRNMIELFGHRLESTLGRSLLVLQETLRATNVLSDIFTTRAHFEWMLQSIGHIFRQHPQEDVLLQAHILLGLCKAAAFIWVGGTGGPMPMYAPSPVELVRSLDEALGSPSPSLQCAALRCVQYLCDARVDAVMVTLMPALHAHLLALTQPSTAAQGHPLRCVSAISCAANLVCNYRRECDDQGDFTRRILKALATLASDDGGAETISRAAMQALERLSAFGCVPASLCDAVCAVAADRIFALSLGRCFKAIGLMVTSVYAIRHAEMLARGDAPPDEEDDDIPMGPSPSLQTMEAVSTLFDRMRRGFYRESRAIVAALGPLLGSHFPAQQIMSIVMGEFLSSQQTHPELLAALVHDVFSRVRAVHGGQETLREWVLLSLKSFTQKEPRSVAAWSLACLFTSASRNPLLRALHHPLQQKRGLVTPADCRLLVTSALDFFHNQGLQPMEKKMFLAVFSALPYAPFPDLVTRCTHVHATDVIVDG
eukprot:Opistho-2@95885